jgi:predicted nucleic acid-binding Zn ribbon protein
MPLNARGYGAERVYESPHKVCAGCGTPLQVQRHQGNPRRWCSERCRLAKYRNSDPERAARQAQEAGHRASLSRQAAREAAPPKTTACLQCGQLFEQRAGGRRTICSNRCRNRRSHLGGDQARRRSNRQAVTARRRALRRLAVVEFFTNLEIFERDGWMCGICGEAVDPGCVYPDLMSASIDHVIPLVAGGQHSRDNVQCAHFICNSLKAARSTGPGSPIPTREAANGRTRPHTEGSEPTASEPARTDTTWRDRREAAPGPRPSAPRRRRGLASGHPEVVAQLAPV